MRPPSHARRDEYHPAMSFRITEDYVQAAIELADAGYDWQPHAGDWILDRDDHSLGLLTTPIEDGTIVKRLNVHIPTFAQVEEMFESFGVTETNDAGVTFSADDATLVTFDAETFDADPALCRLKALAAAVIRMRSGA